MGRCKKYTHWAKQEKYFNCWRHVYRVKVSSNQPVILSEILTLGWCWYFIWKPLSWIPSLGNKNTVYILFKFSFRPAWQQFFLHRTRRQRQHELRLCKQSSQQGKHSLQLTAWHPKVCLGFVQEVKKNLNPINKLCQHVFGELCSSSRHTKHEWTNLTTDILCGSGSLGLSWIPLCIAACVRRCVWQGIEGWAKKRCFIFLIELVMLCLNKCCS